MFGFRKSSRKPATSRPAKSSRKATLAVEALEERQMLSGTPLSADADRSLTTPTGSEWYSGVDANFLSARVQQANMRISDLHVESTAPYRFTATLVKHAGDYGHAWWRHVGLTASQLSDTLARNQALITDLESDSVKGQR